MEAAADVRDFYRTLSRWATEQMTQSDAELASMIETACTDMHFKIYSIIAEYCSENGIHLDSLVKVLRETDDYITMLVDTHNLPRALLQILYKFVVFESAAVNDETLRMCVS